jgi:transposase
MAKKRTRSYTEEFRRQAVYRADQPGKTAREVADELGIHVGQIYNWRTQFNKLSKNQFKTLNGLEYSSDESAELKRLQVENKKLKEENELLKKATAYFASLNK